MAVPRLKAAHTLLCFCVTAVRIKKPGTEQRDPGPGLSVGLCEAAISHLQPSRAAGVHSLVPPADWNRWLLHCSCRRLHDSTHTSPKQLLTPDTPPVPPEKAVQEFSWAETKGVAKERAAAAGKG